ncbi:MAG: ABC transporter permease [Alphaproteobacteria bacterium]|jgi:peptide/nickel transport system permease protein|nr:ABC transporter permease [Alphaproteobacteria bacterium]
MRGVIAQIWGRSTGRLGLILVVLILIMGLGAQVISPYDPNELDILNRFSDPTWIHPMGTDHLGRDLFSRMLYGTQTALLVAVSTIIVSLVVGTLMGIGAAYAPREVERAILILFDIISSFPSLVFALAVVALLGPGLGKVVLIVSITLLPHFGRVARAQVLSLKNAPFLEAERVLGASRARLVLVHIVPNIMGPLVVLASMDIPVVITIEAGLSFLGVGVPPPLASWGTLLNDGYANLTETIWPVAFAGLMLTLATLGFTLFGEALRDAIDPKLKTDR